MDRFEEAKLRVKQAVDLVEFVLGYIPLTRRGRYMVALCPFHDEKTPSFTVYPDSQHYKCYGCGKAGDVFSFLMEREGVSFREAFEQLAEQVGVQLDGVFSRGPDSRPRLDAHRVLSIVRDWFGRNLDQPEGAAARTYLAERGLAPAVAPFGLGAHPAVPGGLAELARIHKLPFEVLEHAGLLGRTDDGGIREPMLGRVMFPIADERGRIVGFGGRVLPDGRPDDRRPKYRNSPESPFFNKRRILFGLRQVKESGERRVVVVEGYTDVIACHLAGLRGTVATLGTSLTREHARLLERYATDGVVLLFDGDRAGRQAADRAFRELVHTTLSVRIALLPEGCDPADLAGVAPGRTPAEVSAGRERLRALIDGAEDALTMWFRLLEQGSELSRDVFVERAARTCSRILSDVESLARREALQREMARHLGVSERALQPGRSPRLARSKPSSAEPATSAGHDPMRASDLDLLACVLVEPALIRETHGQPGPELATILGWIEECGSEAMSSGEALSRALFARCSEKPEDLRSFLAESLDRSLRIRDVRDIFSMLQRGRGLHFARQEADKIKVELKRALADGDRARADVLTLEYVDRLKEPEATGS